MIRTTKNIVLALIVIIIVMVGYLVLNTENNKIGNISTSENIDEYVGSISSTKDGDNIYTSQKYKLRFIYPKSWSIGDNHLGDGTFQIFNYDESHKTGKSIFLKGQNKIEVVIEEKNIDATSSDYLNEKVMKNSFTFFGQPATKVEVELIGGHKVLYYFISLPNFTNKYLRLSIYGDPSNFYILDNLIKHLTWLDPIETPAIISATSSVAQWETYKNTSNHYKIKYPQDGGVQQVEEEERGFLEESMRIIVHGPDSATVGITAWNLPRFRAIDESDAEFIRTLSLDIKSFAEIARQKEIGDKNPNFPNKKVGELQEIEFANQKAFLYTVTGSMDGYGHSDDNYLFLENNHIKYAIYYSADYRVATSSRSIVDTFELE